MAERVESPSATTGTRDPGYVEVDASGKPVGKAGELSEEQKEAARAAGEPTADDSTPVNAAKPEPTSDGDTEPDEGENDEQDRENTAASAVDVTSPSEEDVAVSEAPEFAFDTDEDEV
jgi:hypothetical protein